MHLRSAQHKSGHIVHFFISHSRRPTLQMGEPSQAYTPVQLTLNFKKRKLVSVVEGTTFTTAHPLFTNFPYDSLVPYWDPAWERTELTWCKTLQLTWETVPDTKQFWDSIFSAETLDMTIFHLSRALKLTRRACRASLRAGITLHRRSVAMPHWVFHRFVWSRLQKDEKLQDVSPSVNVYKAQITSMKRMAEMFGREFLVRGLSTGDRVMIAPRARVISTWTPEGKENLPDLLAVSAQKDDYVAVLNIFEDCDWAWIWRFKQGERCRILGLDIQGSYGLFPKSALEIKDRIEIKFSDSSYKMRISFPFFRFNSCGYPTSATHVISLPNQSHNK